MESKEFKEITVTFVTADRKVCVKLNGNEIFSVCVRELVNSSALLNAILSLRRFSVIEPKDLEAFIAVVEVASKHYLRGDLRQTFCPWGTDHRVSWPDRPYGQGPKTLRVRKVV